ncbi:hypothetical protein [Acidisarcina polymorpha]|uniref:hypothetical protein n=1 Tax=Acidisarcina polymorpha TaxID=2211140 RepID=UPI001F422FF9|nr:hypothetical protein [Acidisarcina polymorpha]
MTLRRTLRWRYRWLLGVGTAADDGVTAKCGQSSMSHVRGTGRVNHLGVIA